MSSELQANQWSVISEHGCEASGLTHEEARRLAHRLEGEDCHGLCIITDEAAGHLVKRAAPERVSC